MAFGYNGNWDETLKSWSPQLTALKNQADSSKAGVAANLASINALGKTLVYYDAVGSSALFSTTSSGGVLVTGMTIPVDLKEGDVALVSFGANTSQDVTDFVGLSIRKAGAVWSLVCWGRDNYGSALGYGQYLSGVAMDRVTSDESTSYDLYAQRGASGGTVRVEDMFMWVAVFR